MADEIKKPNVFQRVYSAIFESDDGFYVSPDDVKKIEQPFVQNIGKDTTEFGDLRSDIKDADVTNGTNFLSPFGMFQQTNRSHNDLIQQYRKISELSYVNDAVDEIVNEAVVWDDDPKDPVFITWNDKRDEVSDQLKQKIQEEFASILDLLNFDDDGGDFFRQWYVDGRIIFQIILNKRNLKEGIKKVKLMSPLDMTRIYDETEQRYFWIYDDNKMKDEKGNDVVGKIPDELLVYVPSGLYMRDEVDRHVSISYLHPAIRDINRLDVLEDHLLIYRIVRAPERRVFYIDSGNLGPAKAEEYLRQVIASWKSKKTYDEVLGATAVRSKTPSMLEDIFLLRRNGKSTEVSSLPGGCLTLDTMIPLLDGRELPLKEIIKEHDAGKQNWVYSTDPKTGDVKPGKIDWAGITKRNTQIMKITLDNGKEIRCTPEHKFPIWGKGKVEAKELNIGDSVIPFNTKDVPLKGSKKGTNYRHVYNNDTKKWEPVHKMVANATKGTLFEQTFEYKDASAIKSSPELFRLILDLGKDLKLTQREELLQRLNSNEQAMETFKRDNEGGHPNFTGKFTGRNLPIIMRNAGYKDWRHAMKEVGYYNHQIVAIEYFKETEDVGDLQIDNKHLIHDYHTYAVSAGVFVSNSGLGELGDLMYFRQRVANALKVPFTRINVDEAKAKVGVLSPTANEITMEEVKFHKFINKLRRKFSVLFFKLLHRQLIYKNIIKPDEWASIKRKIKFVWLSDAMFTEAKRLQNLAQKMELLDKAKDHIGVFFSKHQVYTKVLGMSPEDILELEREIAEEESNKKKEEPGPGMAPGG